MHTFTSDVSGKEFPESQKVHVDSIRKGVLEIVRKDHPGQIKNISLGELDHFRELYIEQSMRAEIDSLTSLEKEVMQKLKNHELISEGIGKNLNEKYTLGERVADKVAAFGGSWKFIISFCIFIFIWIAVNVVGLIIGKFDPYPFILLNLMLSCIAALQAPVIMMSQNRAEEKDRQRAVDDYKINLKSEIEVRTLHEKIDHLIIHQQSRLFEMQNIQIDMLRQIESEVAAMRRCRVKENKPRPGINGNNEE